MEPRTVVKLYCNWFQQAQAKEINNYVIAPCRIVETIVEKKFSDTKCCKIFGNGKNNYPVGCEWLC